MNSVAPKELTHSVKYVHLREYNVVGEPLPQGGITVAFTRVKERETPEGYDLYWASKAECSARDNFCKKIGRSIAQGRLRKGIVDEVSTNKTKLKEVAEEMEQWALAK